MRIFLFLLFIFGVGCSKPTSLKGNWQLLLNIQGKSLPVIIKLNKPYNGLISGELVNSTETIELNGSYVDNTFSLDIGTAYAKLNGSLLEDGTLKGTWVRTLKKDFQVGFTGEKTSLEDLYSSYENQKNLIDMTGKWKVSLGLEKYGLAVFKQNGSHVTGSILTETGDFRFLNGFIEKNTLKFYGFDGTFSNVFELIVQNNNFQGMHYSGNKFQQKISGSRDQSFELANPNKLTILKEGIDKFKLPKMKSLLGEEIDLASEQYDNKVKVIQLFGSWCPNCMDETQFFVDWRKNNSIMLNDVEFIALAWENFETQEQASKALRKYKVKHQMDYPIIIMDHKSTKTVLKTIPFEKMIAFPTTLFLGKDNTIEKVHTGFAGQATGPYFDMFVKEFHQTLIDLVKK